MLKFLNTKKGFTLVELLIVVLVMGVLTAIAIPAYGSVTRGANIKICRVQRKDLVAQAENWCIRNNFNADFNYAITSTDGITPIVKEHELPLSQDQIYLLETEIHPNLSCCPSYGTYVITVKPHTSGIPIVTLTCDGGEDGDLHKDAE